MINKAYKYGPLLCGLVFACVNACELAWLNEKVALVPSQEQADCAALQSPNSQLRQVKGLTSTAKKPSYANAATPLNYNWVTEHCDLHTEDLTLVCALNGKKTHATLPLIPSKNLTLSYNHWQLNGYYFIGITDNNPESTLGFVRFDNNASPSWLNNQNACQHGLSTEVIKLNSGQYLCNSLAGGWQHSTLQALPAPCTAPQQMLHDSNGIWALQYERDSISWQVCQLSLDNAQLLQAYLYSPDISATLAALNLISTHTTTIAALYGEFDNAQAYALAVTSVSSLKKGDLNKTFDYQIPVSQLLYRLQNVPLSD
ncbi:hypothetical protein PSECIP111951_03158 [Pseudoalteromonas holothuriae]|uniref:Uncharacterized protein n=1 Tax=Pseudoalteromonas holothuriae TaxID=2963714 RepID=A0A9W4R1I3_9GAMM|nr:MULTISPECIES: hypothetical protein [unclassified Pseudoalteromonas]CAH9063894.1 hypothetical protein PSECIP111854_03315 [Pseudoalteromonas sp. CIP111854]CAH9064548.1 hypothetical protein PSECIP111951_03158 [Pseudoalteromonas sp. CIP111951]